MPELEEMFVFLLKGEAQYVFIYVARNVAYSDSKGGVSWMPKKNKKLSWPK